MASYSKRDDIEKQFQKKLEESGISKYRSLGWKVSELLDDDERIEVTLPVKQIEYSLEEKLWIFTDARLVIGSEYSVDAYVFYSDLYSVAYSDKLFSRNSGKIMIELPSSHFGVFGSRSSVSSLTREGFTLEGPKTERRVLAKGLDKNQGSKLAAFLRSNVHEAGTVQYFETQPWLQARQSSNFEAEAVQYFETPIHDGDVAFCSDDGCDCGMPGARIPRGQGYLYISDEVVEDRRNCLTVVEWERKLEMMRGKLGERLGGPVNLYYTVVPELCCERSARRRGLDLEVAAADARQWWSNGKLPLRPTPKR